MLNKAQLDDLHEYSLKRQTIMSARSKISYRLQVALSDFHTRWESEIIRSAILKYNLDELDANFLAKYPVPKVEPEAPPAPKAEPEPEPVLNFEINLEPLIPLTGEVQSSVPPVPVPPVPPTIPAFVPASMPALDTSARFKMTETDWIVTPEHFVMYCKMYPKLMMTFNASALRKIDACKDIQRAKASVVMFYRHQVLMRAGFDTTHYVKACLAHAFVIQYPEHAGTFDVVHYVAKSGKSLYCKLAALWKSEGLPVYR
jgi:hypothetical protein